MDELVTAADLWEQRSRASRSVATVLPHQRPPAGDWLGWLMLGGRGSGKTHACARTMIDHVNGPPCLSGPTPHWLGIIAPTLGDAATSCYKGPSGIGTQDPSTQMVTTKGGTEIRWPNGSVGKLFGTDTPGDVERLRAGGNRCFVWLEELAAWRYAEEAFDQMRFGLRAGPNPRWIGSTTPKPKKLIKKLAEGAYRGVVLSRATTYDNPFLPADILAELEESYGGREIGRQELYAEIIDEAEGALWSRQNLDDHRIRPAEAPPMDSIVVGVDPSGGAGEQGIVVAGRRKLILPQSADAPGPNRPESHGFVLADRTVSLSPAGWGKAAVRAAVEFEAREIACEINYGGDMVLSTVRAACEAEGVHIPTRKLTASRGKRVRAEPVAALAETGRWHMVGTFPELEEQLCTWTDDLDWSPDRLDAMVWTAWALRLVALVGGGRASMGGSVLAGASLTGGR